MSNFNQQLYQANADGEIVEQIRAIAETLRYASGPTLERLVHIVVGTGSGPNRDAPLYELCHLVNIVDACGFVGDNRLLLFMGIERVLPTDIKDQIKSKLKKSGWQREGFKVDEKGISITYPDQIFEVRYGRMPLLFALHEFLSGMDGFTFITELNDIFDEMLAGSPNIKAIKKATGKLASKFRKYRHAHVEWAKHEEKFDRMASFLTKRSSKSIWCIDDAAVLEFWIAHDQGKEQRAYKTVFDSFVTLLRTIQRSSHKKSAESAQPLGADWETDEVDISETDRLSFDDFAEWQSPLLLFDKSKLSGINFFKASTERKHIENLMIYGPDAGRLPLAFLRLESFAQLQSGITNDLRLKRGSDIILERISCDNAPTYIEKEQQFQSSLKHIVRLQKSVLFLLLGSEEEGVSDIDENITSEILDDAQEVFLGMKRKGFHNKEIDEEQQEVFQLAAESLVTMSYLIKDFLAKVENFKFELKEQFKCDQETFSTQFKKIYGDFL